jgi:hypothetical protein
MHSRSIVALALVAVLPACAFAQRGRIATNKSPADPASTPIVRYPTVGDVEDHNPASLLVGKRKKLALADSTVAQLKALGLLSEIIAWRLRLFVPIAENRGPVILGAILDRHPLLGTRARAAA